MDFLTVITIIGGIILTVGYIPQLIKLFKTEETAGINNGFWYLITTAVTITAINLIIDSAPIVLIIIQIVNATLAGVVLLTVHLYRKEYTMMNLPVLLVLSVILIAGVLLPLEVTQSIASLSIVTAYLTQLVTLFKAPSIDKAKVLLHLLKVL